MPQNLLCQAPSWVKLCLMVKPCRCPIQQWPSGRLLSPHLDATWHVLGVSDTQDEGEIVRDTSSMAYCMQSARRRLAHLMVTEGYGQLSAKKMQLWCKIDLFHKSHNASGKYPAMHHFVTEMWPSLLQCDALWDVWLVHCGICGTGARFPQLSCHVQNFVATSVFESRWEWNEFSMKFELWWKKTLVKQGPGLLCLFYINKSRKWLLFNSKNGFHLAQHVFSKKIALNLVSRSPNEKKRSPWVQVMPWHQAGDKPLPQLMWAQFTYTSISLIYFEYLSIQWINFSLHHILSIHQHWFRQRSGRVQVTRHYYLSQWWHSSLGTYVSESLNELK